jgi:two-component system, chemotaxis family, protein-glutamate methylesterase/glutaminase
VSVRVLVIDDSAYNRVTITRMLQSDSRVEVVGTAVNGEDGIKQVMKHRPDAVTLDLEMPIMDGFAFLRWLMVNLPTPVIVVSSKSSDRSVFKALELGALDFIAKPGGRVSPRLEEIRRDLVAKVLQIADLRLENLKPHFEEEAEVAKGPAVTGVCPVDAIVIGCSTGGPPALQHLLQQLPRLPVPFVIAQHMPPTFTRLFAERVNKLTTWDVKEASDGELLVPGSVYVAPGGQQSEVRRVAEGLQVRVFPAGLNDLHAPSVDRLFRSASDACRERLVAIIMTGMGDDGAEAMRVVKERGGRTIAESSESAIIFGMPAEAIRTGAVDDVLALSAIPSAIKRLCT